MQPESECTHRGTPLVSQSYLPQCVYRMPTMTCVGRYIRMYVHMCNSVSAYCGTYVCYRHYSVVILSGFVSMFVETLWDVLDGDDDERLVSATTGPLDPTDRVAHKVHQPVCSPVTSNNHLTSCHITSLSPNLSFPHVHPHLTSCSPSPHLMFTLISPHVYPHPHFTSCLPSPSPHLMFTLTLTSPHVYPHPRLTSLYAHPHLTLILCLPSPHLTHIHTDLTFTSCSPSPHLTSCLPSPHLYFMPTLTSPHLMFTLTSPLLHAHPHLNLIFTSCPSSP